MDFSRLKLQNRFPQQKRNHKTTQLCILCLPSHNLLQNEEEHDPQNAPFTPGPTPLLPAANLPWLRRHPHRTAEFRALFQKVLAQLKVFVGRRTTCCCWRHRHGRHGGVGFNLTSRATGASADGGKFGERGRAAKASILSRTW